MNIYPKKLLFCCFNLLIIIVLIESSVYATPYTINYQEFLTDSNRMPLNRTVKMKFEICNEKGVCPWLRERYVTPKDGFLNIALGKKIPLKAIFFDGKHYLNASFIYDQSKYIKPKRQIISKKNDDANDKLQPLLTMMVATGLDRIKMTWIHGTDGKTPTDKVQYDIHLGLSKNFTPDTSNLMDIAIGKNQIEIAGLTLNTLYYGKVVANYSTYTIVSSNTLQCRTYPYSIQKDPTTKISNSLVLGLGKHTSSDGVIYKYSRGIPPSVDSILFSEDISGGMTIRRVESVSASNNEITVITSDASLVEVLDRASIYTSFKLFDIAKETASFSSKGLKIARAKSFLYKDGSHYSRIEWKEKLLSAEQIIYAYNDDDFSVKPHGKKSVAKFIDSKGEDSSFEATIYTDFEPDLITFVKWGNVNKKKLDFVKVAAKGTLTLTAIAQYKFTKRGKVSKSFKLWKKNWAAWHNHALPLPPYVIPVFQEITMSMDVEASAKAKSEIKAMAESQLSETLELGAIYDGEKWTPYITHNEDTSLNALLDIKGKASAEIRLIPKIEVKFYKIFSANLSVEPYLQSSLTVEKTTDNSGFLISHPEYALQLTSFNASIGIEANISSYLKVLGSGWELLPSTCVIGTGPCLKKFDDIKIFSIPKLELKESSKKVQLKVKDGAFNTFSLQSVKWYVFPEDATIKDKTCIRKEKDVICKAVLVPGEEDEYTVFASGYGILGEPGRQFKEISVDTSEFKIPKTVSFYFQGSGSGVKECSGYWGYQRVKFNQDIYFEIEGDNPVQSGEFVFYDLSKKQGKIHFYGTAEDSFWDTKSKLNFNISESIDIDKLGGVFSATMDSPNNKYVGFSIKNSSERPCSKSIQFIGWKGIVRNGVNMPYPWNSGVGCINNFYDVSGTIDFKWSNSE